MNRRAKSNSIHPLPIRFKRCYSRRACLDVYKPYGRRYHTCWTMLSSMQRRYRFDLQ